MHKLLKVLKGWFPRFAEWVLMGLTILFLILSLLLDFFAQDFWLFWISPGKYGPIPTELSP